MTALTLDEFEAYCLEYSPNVFTVCSSNQAQDSYPLQMEFRFNEILINKFSKRIGFKSNNGYICLNEVDHVDVYDDPDVIGLCFGVVCKPRYGKTQTYVIVADRLWF